MSDVLIINLFESSIGLNNGGSIPLLERVMEASLMMKIREDKGIRTTLLVLIRDYKPKMVPLEEHRRTINEIINNIWEYIQKPKGEENRHWEEYFELIVYGLKDIIPDEHIEEERIQEVKNIFHDKNSKDYLFRNKENRLKGFLMKELEELVPRVWSEICLNKSLDVMSQREYIVYKRCDDVKKEIAESAKEKISKFVNEVKEKKKNSKEVIEELKRFEKEWIKEFEEKAPHYLEHVYNSKLEELKREIEENYAILNVTIESVEFEIKAKNELTEKSREQKKLRDEVSKKVAEISEMGKVMKNKENEHEKTMAELKKQTEDRIKAEKDARDKDRKSHELILKQQEILREKEKKELETNHKADMNAAEINKQKEIFEIEKKHTAEKEEQLKKTQEQIQGLEKRVIEAENARRQAVGTPPSTNPWNFFGPILGGVVGGMLF
jgi:hypothetical protein